jgi:hypothetical protein
VSNASSLSRLSLQGIDLEAGGRNKCKHRTAPKSENVYLKLLVKVRARCSPGPAPDPPSKRLHNQTVHQAELFYWVLALPVLATGAALGTRVWCHPPPPCTSHPPDPRTQHTRPIDSFNSQVHCLDCNPKAVY